ncbi:MAG: bacteriocin-protection protein [Blastocatellia bacterium]|nr:MAG: bacteriocin-protection protein [Blastocatellia bacterium]
MQSETVPKFFTSAAAFRKWLEQNHKKKSELWVGFHKKSSGKKSITYPQALDEALCYGWIDGLRKNVSPDSYKIRFTPRKASSIWSNINVAHVERLKKESRMQAAGLAAYSLRDPERTGIYSFEKELAEFSTQFKKRFEANKNAWQFFNEQSPYIKKLCVHWVMSAKREETRVRRLEQLIEKTAKGERVGVIESKPNKK